MAGVLVVAGWGCQQVLGLEAGKPRPAGEGGSTSVTGSGSGSSATGGSAMGGGGPGDCETARQCPILECNERGCESGRCTQTPLPVGTVCGDNQKCDGAGVCLVDNGDPCDTSSQCASDECVDGVCCDTACPGLCRACDVTGSEGTCSDVPFASDPADECSDSYCDGDGACYDCEGPGGTPVGSCPGECDYCDGSVCIICGLFDCPGTITCPDGWECHVPCTGGCQGAIINCSSDGFPCQVDCSTDGCQGAQINCNGAPCEVNCIKGDPNATDTCKGMNVECGTFKCEAECDTVDKPNLTCNESCNCVPCN